jgi:hypothetical protein
MKELNVRAKTLKLLDENVVEIPQVTGIATIF